MVKANVRFEKTRPVERRAVPQDAAWTIGDGVVSGESSRLLYEPFCSCEAAELHAVLTCLDAEMFHDNSDWSMEDTLAWIDEPQRRDPREHRSIHQFGVRERDTGACIGVADVVYDPAVYRRDCVDFTSLGYLVDYRARNKGYGVEIVRSLVDLSFGHLKVDEIHASVDPENASSLRVLQKAGLYVFRYLGICADLRDHARIVCALARDEWLEGRSISRSLVKEIGLFSPGWRPHP